jgi:hypothetical protein
MSPIREHHMAEAVALAVQQRLWLWPCSKRRWLWRGGGHTARGFGLI